MGKRGYNQNPKGGEGKEAARENPPKPEERRCMAGNSAKTCALTDGSASCSVSKVTLGRTHKWKKSLSQKA